MKRETPGRGCQLDLHGVQLNVTTINADQNHEQHVGIEHIAIETDDYPGALANFKKNGAHVLARISQRGRCIGLLNLRKSCCHSGLSQDQGKPDADGV